MKFLKYFILICTLISAAQANHVAISQVAQHPSLDQIKKGIEDTLKDFDTDIKISIQNAQGNPALATQIAHKFISDKADVVVGIGTLTSQTLFNASKGKIPLVFSAVTDPESAGLLQKSTKPFVTGTKDFPPLEKQLNFIDACFPKAKVIGVLYNPGEVNTTQQVYSFKKLATEMGYTVRIAPAFKTSDVMGAAQKLLHSVDILYIPNDNTVVSAIESVIRASKKANKPLFVSDPDSFEKGADAVVAHDQYEVGVATGHQIIEILKGKNPGNIPVKQEFKVFQKKRN